MSGADESLSEETAQRASRLRVSEIFHSLQGEAREVGRPTVFVRLTGCPLRCVWCDTEYAFHGGARRTLVDIVGESAKNQKRHICVTRGEAPAQKRRLLPFRPPCGAGSPGFLQTA